MRDEYAFAETQAGSTLIRGEVARVVDKNRRLARQIENLCATIREVRQQRDAETARADAAERRERDMRAELDRIRDRMREARAYG